MCAAPFGNQFWKLRSKHGRDKIFKTPELMWEAACEYFEWVDTHPLEKKEIKSIEYGNASEDSNKATPKEVKTSQLDRPYTISGVSLYFESNSEYLNQFKKGLDVEKNELDKDFSRVIRKIEEIIYTQKFEGATVGKFNANIIARDLGLKDKSEVATTEKPYVLSLEEKEELERIERLSGVENE